MAQAERNDGRPARNPLIWIALVVVALVLFILFGGSRPALTPAGQEAVSPPSSGREVRGEPEAGQVETAMTPGQEARDYIRRLRQQDAPIPFDEIMRRAAAYLRDGRLADAWLLYFFAAREGHVEAMMTLAEMSDPNRFSADNNLLDRAEPVQAYKWYRRALTAGFEPARQRLAALRDWAERAAARGDRDARILMLNFQ